MENFMFKFNPEPYTYRIYVEADVRMYIISFPNTLSLSNQTISRLEQRVFRSDDRFQQLVANWIETKFYSQNIAWWI